MIVHEPNAVRFDPSQGRDHVESYFLKGNDPTGERAFWIKATIFATAREPDRPVAEGWAIAFDRRGGVRKNVAVKHSLPYAEASFDRHGLGVRWALPIARVDSDPSAQAALQDGLTLEPGLTRGAISTRQSRLTWDLRFSGDERPIVPFPYQALYRWPFPKSKLVTPYPDVRFEGALFVDGERWQIDGWRGMQGHNWGRGHTDLYAWCHANCWNEEPDFVLEGLSGKVRLGPVMTPLVTIVCVRHRGVVYDFNRPLEIARAGGDVSLRRWTFSSKSRRASIEGIVEAETDDMVGLYYPNPGGAMTYCLNSKLASARIRFEAEGSPPLSLTTRSAALEIGTHEADHGVTMHVAAGPDGAP